jgi:hypothetical protein
MRKTTRTILKTRPNASIPVIDAVSVVASNSVPPPLVRTSVSGSPVLVWPASAMNYSLQLNTNPPSGSWQAASNGTPFTGLQVTNAPGNAFFRLH